jgi:hypothetical protein
VALPETRYAENGGLHVAYQLVGDGPVDVVLLTQWFSNVDSQWDVPPLAAFIRRLAAFGRVPPSPSSCWRPPRSPARTWRRRTSFRQSPSSLWR